MWMMVWRPLVVLAGLLGLGEAAVVTTVVSLNPVATDSLMYFVFVLMALQAVFAVGCLVAAVWGPIARRLGQA